MADIIDSYVNENGNPVVSVWFRRGPGHLVRRDAVGADDPNSYYMQIKNLGLIPEEFGYYNDDSKTVECPHCHHKFYMRED